MSQNKLILDVVQNIKNLANSLEVFADGLMEGQGQPVVPEKKKQSVANSEITPVKSEVTLEEVRAILARQSQAGYTEQVRSILTRFDAKKLSEVQPQYYEEILLLAEELSND